jgi:hypothetical protein
MSSESARALSTHLRKTSRGLSTNSLPIRTGTSEVSAVAGASSSSESWAGGADPGPVAGKDTRYKTRKKIVS